MATLYGTICDSCSMAGEDEAEGFGLEEDDIVQVVLMDMGGDIADHICDATETDGEVKCACSCRKRS